MSSSPRPLHLLHHPSAVVPRPSSSTTSANSPLCSRTPPHPKHNGDPTSSTTPITHGENIPGEAKRLFGRRRGGPCSGIAVSCRIKEASKIAALNYIPADERHANNGRCTRSLGTSGLVPRSGDGVHAVGSPRGHVLGQSLGWPGAKGWQGWDGAVAAQRPPQLDIHCPSQLDNKCPPQLDIPVPATAGHPSAHRSWTSPSWTASAQHSWKTTAHHSWTPQCPHSWKTTAHHSWTHTAHHSWTPQCPNSWTPQCPSQLDIHCPSQLDIHCSPQLDTPVAVTAGYPLPVTAG